MELKLNVSKVLILDTPFKLEMLENDQAVLGEMEGETLLIKKVNYDEIINQVNGQSKTS